ncbi:MAG: HYR domain-containing protein [Saprospiraceae bacterium]|nr:HYR domain-containing protein [Saprospiraceae bacterium]
MILILLGSYVGLVAQCPHVTAYTGASAVGNQSYNGQLGLSFSTNANITIDSLGAFDSGGDGFTSTITVGIVNGAGTTVVNPITFTSAQPGNLNGNFRMKSIVPVTLPAGNYTLVAVGFSATDQNGNANLGGFPTVVTNTGGGIITFGSSPYSATTTFGGLPASPYATVGGYHSGTFTFVSDLQPPVIVCPSDITMAADLDRCSAVVCFSVTATDNCAPYLPVTLPNHTYIGTYNGHTYFRSNLIPAGILSWEQANAAAVSLGGHLLSVTDQNEQTFLNNNLPNGIASQFWIGLRYSPSLGQFKWTSGEPVTFTNWGVGQPVFVPIIGGDYVYHLEVANATVEGWYNIVPQVPRRYIVEFEGYPVTLLSTIPSGSNFPVGVTPVTYQVSDVAGNTASCSFSVIVQDKQAPTITCPSDFTLNIKTPGVCDTTATWGPITVSDNCPWPMPLDTMRIGINANKPRGSAFDYGVHPISYQVTDASGNTASCTFNITIRDFVNPSLGCKPVNLSLDSNCKGVLHPVDVLTGWEHISGIPQLGCDTLYKIKLIGSNGQILNDTITNELLGKTVTYSISHPNGFTCWNTVLVEDKIKPVIICPTADITVSCLADISKIAPPAVSDNCSGAKAILVSEETTPLKCDATYIGIVKKIWKVIDGVGNVGDSLCTQTIKLLRSTFTGITPPTPNIIFKCSDNYKKDNKGFGYPHPDTTGVPKLGLQKLWPLSELNMVYCNAAVDYEDRLILASSCKTRISRTWTITEWHCDSVKIIPIGVQMFDIIDDVAPVIPQLPFATFSTQTRSCTGLVTFPTLNITDNCNSIYKVFINATQGGPSGYIDGNGGTMVLALGAHSITYTAIDACGNTSTMTYRITIVDKTDPVALCDQFATISLKTNGYTEITATAVDDGSYDECGAVTLKIRRMEDPCHFGADTAWYDKVGFCCLDANTTRMVQLQVTDASGNTNICMVSVQVQDKVNPSVTCPPDISMQDCLFTFDKSNPAGYFGAVTVSDNCPSNTTVKDTITSDSRTQCGIGTIIRTVTVSEGNTIFSTCTQRITFTNSSPFTGEDITWPRDTIITGQCSPLGLDTTVTGAPRFNEDACDMVGLRYDDQIFSFTTGGACFKIIRTWTVLDWCQRNTDNTIKTWSFEQEIKVMDTIKPILNILVSSTFESLDCKTGDVTLSATATDCTPAQDLIWSWVIKKGLTIDSSGTGNSVSDEFPLGDYTITWTVTDRCGNSTSGTQNFSIITKKAPTATCKQGLAAPLVLMDTNNDGIGDTYMASLKPMFFDNKSGHACDIPVKLSFSPDVNDTTRVYSCDSFGIRIVRLYVTDIYGNQSFCETFVDIQATNAQCPNVSPLLANVSGKAAKEGNDEIEGVMIDLKGSEQSPVMTDNNGLYSFKPMPTGGNYQVVPGKDGDDLNGVSTLDIVMVQRHILGIEKLKTPYQIIAADANNSGSVTAADLTELRKLVLGLLPAFPNNTSWRFVDANFKFTDPQDPWMTPFAERYDISQLKGNMESNFVGIKIGDVNGNAKSKNVNDNISVSRSKFDIGTDNIIVSRGDIIEIPIVANTSGVVLGMQAQLKTNGLIIREIKDGQLKLRYEDMIITSINEAKLSIVSPSGSNIDKGEVLFIIEVEAISSGKLSDMLQLGQTLSPEVYTMDMDTKSLTLSWRDKSLKEFILTGVVPNPWNSQTKLTFDMPKDGVVTFKVKDYTGRSIISTSEQYKIGSNAIQLNRADIGQAGVYVYEIRFEDKVLSGKMIIID